MHHLNASGFSSEEFERGKEITVPTKPLSNIKNGDIISIQFPDTGVTYFEAKVTGYSPPNSHEIFAVITVVKASLP